MSTTINQAEFEQLLFEGKTDFRNCVIKNLKIKKAGFMELKFYNCAFEDCSFENCSFFEIRFTNCYFGRVFISDSAFKYVNIIECKGADGMINNSDVSDFRVTGGEYIEFYIANNKLSNVSISSKTAFSPDKPDPEVVLKTMNSSPIIVPKPAKQIDFIQRDGDQIISIDITAINNIKKLIGLL